MLFKTPSLPLWKCVLPRELNSLSSLISNVVPALHTIYNEIQLHRALRLFLLTLKLSDLGRHTAIRIKVFAEGTEESNIGFSFSEFGWLYKYRSGLCPSHGRLS